jgi:hypothetical protein
MRFWPPGQWIDSTILGLPDNLAAVIDCDGETAEADTRRKWAQRGHDVIPHQEPKIDKTICEAVWSEGIW